jgi:Arc/MetJ-type ribon-helix-helix transcriptional regulator
MALAMKTLTVLLPDELVAQIEVESQARKVSKSDVVRERLTIAVRRRRAASLESISDLIGSVDGLPPDLSARKKKYLKNSRYGQKPAR